MTTSVNQGQIYYWHVQSDNNGLTFYVNGQLIGSVTDDTYTGSLYLGLWSVVKNVNYHDNILVTRPSAGNPALAKPTLASTWDISDTSAEALPDTFSVSQNVPNPFNPETTIAFALPSDAHVSLVIYNVLGQAVRTLITEAKPAGHYRVIWNGKDALGQPVASGIYLYRLIANDFITTRKMLILK